jgi:basic membrane protein A
VRQAKITWLLALALLVSGCTPASPEPSVTPVDYRACQLKQRADPEFQADSEQVAYALQKAQATLGIHLYSASVKVTSASTEKVFDSLFKRGCNLIVTTGQTLGALAISTAGKHPTVRFISVNYSNNQTLRAIKVPNNLHLISFDVRGVGFLAGYAAASLTKTGVVGVIAGAPSVRNREYLSGFGSGVAKYNTTLTTVVQVAGKASGDWVYLGADVSPDRVALTAAELVDARADVLFVAAGPASIGVGELAAGNKLKLIFTDSDWWFDPAAESFRAQFATSATVNLIDAIYAGVSAFFVGKFDEVPNLQLGDLSSELTRLAPTHDQSFSISLENELSQLKKEFIESQKAVN